jgi:hypothetical protein
MKFKKRSDSPLHRMKRHGFRGYPLATIVYYGPDDTRASKVAVGFARTESDEATILERLFSETGDVRTDPAIQAAILRLLKEHGVKSVSMLENDHILGCPHEEGKDYPDGEVCPQCPYWANRDRYTGVERAEKARALADWARRQGQ